METTKEQKSFKQKLFHELSEYAFNVIYLTLFFGAYAIARRLTLEYYDIYIDDYFIAPIKALVIGKVIMIAAFLNISKKFEGKPLIIPVLYKVIFFMLFVIAFDATEGFIKGWISIGTMAGGLDTLLHHHFSKMWLGGLVMVVLAFIPFFMIKELMRKMGQQNFRDLFLKGSVNSAL